MLCIWSYKTNLEVIKYILQLCFDNKKDENNYYIYNINYLWIPVCKNNINLEVIKYIHKLYIENNKDLFQTIVQHRMKYTPIRSIDYSLHTPQTINILPPQHALSAWKQDYQIMTANMIYGEAPSFENLFERMKELQERFRKA